MVVVAAALAAGSPAWAEGSTARAAAALVHGGNALLDEGNAGEAVERYRAAARISADVGDQRMRAVAEHNEALALYRMGELAQAEAIFRRLAAARARDVGRSRELVERSTYHLGRSIAERVEREQVPRLAQLSPEARFGQIPVDEALEEYEAEARRIIERLGSADEQFRTARELDPRADDAARNIELVSGRIAEINRMIEEQRQIAEQLREQEQQQEQQQDQQDQQEQQNGDQQQDPPSQQGEEQSGEQEQQSPAQPGEGGQPPRGGEPGEPGDEQDQAQPEPAAGEQEQQAEEDQQPGEMPELVEGPESAELGEQMSADEGEPLADLPPDLRALLQRILDEEAQNRERFRQSRGQRRGVERDW